MKIKSLLFAAMLLTIVMASTASANPAKVIYPNLVIVPDGTTVKEYDITLFDIGEAGIRTVGLNMVINPGTVQARIIGVAGSDTAGLDTGWTNTTTGLASDQWTCPLDNDPATDEYPAKLQVRGTTTGRLQVTDVDGSFAYFDPDCEATDIAFETDDIEIPEFPTIALPVAAILGLAFFFQRRKEE